MKESLFKSLTQLYALLVCFVTLIIILVSLATMGNNCIKIYFPQYKIYYPSKVYESNEAYLRHLKDRNGYNPEQLKIINKLLPDELSEKRLYDKKDKLEEMIHEGYSGMITAFGWFFFSLVFFAIHWRLHKKYKNVNN